VTILAHLRNIKIKPKVKKALKFYNNYSGEDIIKYQIQKFNTQWKYLQKEIPYYKELIEKGIVPKNISSVTDFQKLPILDRQLSRNNMDKLMNGRKKPDLWHSTGGSTGTPLKYPSWKKTSKQYEANIWYARDFYNITKKDKMFRIWGHSHTLGSGFSKYKSKLMFFIGLPLVGYKRFSAYDLSEERLIEAGNQILKFKPKYVIGYSKSLLLLAKANEHNKFNFHGLNLKAIIGAAEGFDNEKDKEYIQKIFGCPVGMEYGSMETNLIAHTHPSGEFKVIWRDNLIECVDDDGNPSESGRILVTSLYDRAFPLVRYELGDIIQNTNKSQISVYEFERIQGRDNDFLMIDEHTPIHSEGITHAIKLSHKVTAYQIRYTKDNVYTIYVTSNESLSSNDYKKIKSRLGQVDPRLANLEIKLVDKLKQTVAGKTKWLIRE